MIPLVMGCCNQQAVSSPEFPANSTIVVVDVDEFSAGKEHVDVYTISGSAIVDWGDGSPWETFSSGTLSHEYLSLGVYDLRIHYFNPTSPSLLLFSVGITHVVEWQDNLAQILFENCSRLSSVPSYVPQTLNNTAAAFFGCSSLSSDLSEWDVSNVTNMTSMFEGCSSLSSDLSEWDVSNVTDMSRMFVDCIAFNSDLSEWDVSNVTNMSRMLEGCSVFNQDLSGWDVGSVINMARMFYGCVSFNMDIGSWDVSSATFMSSMFEGCSVFNQDLSGWCVSYFWDVSPPNFSTGTPAWVLPKPVWGTCP